MIRRRCRRFSRPCSSAASAIASITPSPRWRSSSPSRTKSGSHPSALTVPSLRSRAGAGHHRVAEHRHLARRRHPGPRRQRIPAARTQVTSPDHQRPGRRPRQQGLHSLACINDGRHIRTHKGSWDGRGLDTQTPTRSLLHGLDHPGRARAASMTPAQGGAGHSTAPDHYADRVASKKRRSGKGKGPRQGISGNPQRRAGQLAQRRPAIADEPDLPPLVLDFRSGKPEDSPLRDLAYALAGGAEPRPWWGESHQRILTAARALTWPCRLVDLETQACQIVGDEFYERLNLRLTGLHPPQWLRALAEETGAALRASVAGGTGDWRQLWALLCGLALTAPPGDADSETAKLARARFPDIKDPCLTALAEAGKAAKLLADRGLASGIGHPAAGCRAAGDPLVARDAYGSRFLLVAPFGYDGEADHW